MSIVLQAAAHPAAKPAQAKTAVANLTAVATLADAATVATAALQTVAKAAMGVDANQE